MRATQVIRAAQAGRTPRAIRATRMILVLVLPVLIALCACAKTPPAAGDKTAGPAETQGTAPAGNGKVTIRYDLERINRIASNQVAVWIEDANGNYVKTVYASAFMAKGGYRSRPECCPEWVRVSGWKNAPASEVDAVTGPTQKPGRIVLTWNCTDRQGKPVPPGTYVCRLEGTIFWENRILYRAEIQVGSARSQAKPVAQYLPPAAKDIGEMVKNVSIEFTP